MMGRHMKRPPTCWRQGVAAAAARHRQQRETWAAEARLCWEQWRTDPFFLFGVALYWGEGNKSSDAGQRRLMLRNADPRLLRVWLRWCRRFLPAAPVRGELNIHDGGDAAAAAEFWERELGVVVSSVTVAVSSASKRKRHTLPHGTLGIRVGRGSVEWLTKMLVWLELAQDL